MVWHRRSHFETPLRAIWPAICVAALWPSSAWACDWPPKDVAERFERATDVFVGRVVESPWGRGGVKSSPTFEVRLAVQTRYKGATLSDVTVMPDGDCTFPFVEGESYVVFGSTRLGRFAAATPDEPLLMAENARTGFVWNTFMKNPEAARGMQRAGFKTYQAPGSQKNGPPASAGSPGNAVVGSPTV